MNFVRLLPVLVSFLLLAAHFVRAGQYLIVLALFLLLMCLFIRKEWVPKLFQVVLMIGALEWVRTIISVAQVRIDFGVPWARMALILGVVALFTLLSSLVFRSTALRQRYTEKDASST